MIFEPTLLGFEEDIKNRGFRDWLVAHTSFLKPLHRYEGLLEVDSAGLRYRGRKRRGEGKLSLDIPFDHILDVHLGFDDCFRRSEDRQLGFLSFVPLRIRYRIPGHRERTVYVFADFRRGVIGRRSGNDRLLALLEEAGRGAAAPA